MYRRRFVVAFTAPALFCVSHAAGVPVWSIDPAGLSGFWSAAGAADNFSNGTPAPRFSDNLSVSNFNAGFSDGVNTFDFGRASNIFGSDPGPALSQSASTSALAITTINGDGTNTLRITYRVNGLMDTRDCDDFACSTLASLSATIGASVAGVAGGTPLTINYQWSYFGNAVTRHENLNEDSAQSTGAFDFREPGQLPELVFGESFNGDVLGLRASGSDSGNGSFGIIAGAVPAYSITLSASGQALMFGPGRGPSNEDLNGFEWLAEVTLTIVPAPGATFTLGLAGLVANRRRRTS